jgi:hypothetical protein
MGTHSVRMSQPTQTSGTIMAIKVIVDMPFLLKVKTALSTARSKNR